MSLGRLIAADMRSCYRYTEARLRKLLGAAEFIALKAPVLMKVCSLAAEAFVEPVLRGRTPRIVWNANTSFAKRSGPYLLDFLRNSCRSSAGGRRRGVGRQERGGRGEREGQSGRRTHPGGGPVKPQTSTPGPGTPSPPGTVRAPGRRPARPGLLNIRSYFVTWEWGWSGALP